MPSSTTNNSALPQQTTDHGPQLKRVHSAPCTIHVYGYIESCDVSMAQPPQEAAPAETTLEQQMRNMSINH
jgi:hypothetical protein